MRLSGVEWGRVGKLDIFISHQEKQAAWCLDVEKCLCSNFNAQNESRALAQCVDLFNDVGICGRKIVLTTISIPGHGERTFLAWRIQDIISGGCTFTLAHDRSGIKKESFLLAYLSVSEGIPGALASFIINVARFRTTKLSHLLAHLPCAIQVRYNIGLTSAAIL